MQLLHLIFAAGVCMYLWQQSTRPPVRLHGLSIKKTVYEQLHTHTTWDWHPWMGGTSITQAHTEEEDDDEEELKWEGGAYLNANQNTYRFSNDTRTHYTHQYFMNIQQRHFLLFFYSFIQLKPSAQFLHWIYWTAVNDTDSRVWLHSGAVPQKRHKLKFR